MVIKNKYIDIKLVKPEVSNFVFKTLKYVYNFLQLMTATVETVVEQLDLTPVMPAIARAITLTESDVGKY